MTDVTQLESAIDVHVARNEVLARTVQEMMQANIEFKTGNKLLAKLNAEGAAALKAKETECENMFKAITELTQEKARLERVVVALDLELGKYRTPECESAVQESVVDADSI